MTFLETILLIEERGEKCLAQDTRFIVTDKHRYLRQLDAPESSWHEDTEPGQPERRWGKGGEYWVWKRDELPVEAPIQFPEGT